MVSLVHKCEIKFFFVCKQEAYAAKTGKAVNTVRFMLDGERVEPHQTPEQLDLEDNDTIDVMIEQIGGY